MAHIAAPGGAMFAPFLPVVNTRAGHPRLQQIFHLAAANLPPINGLIAEATRVDPGYPQFTLAGRALQKHSNRAHTRFNFPHGVKQSPANFNNQGEHVATDILNNPARVTAHYEGGWMDRNFLEVHDATGRGVRYDFDTQEFIGFIQ